ncbi:unnamed protein product [Tenebrio molitor]|nr:unnamed protein product [Tenebrio molitor]
MDTLYRVYFPKNHFSFIVQNSPCEKKCHLASSSLSHVSISTPLDLIILISYLQFILSSDN